MRVRKAVITAAGKGSRMKFITSVLPKALIPLFRTEDGKKVMRPVIDLIAENLSSAGVVKFCLVVGKHGKLLMDYLFERGVTFVFQEEPKGFGDAVLRA
ncbi:MAG: NTP transferase domain-containing protein, partial [Sulfolobaceae archaeon]|nr:NTP transferase domain-containing protein [Sulfolobales archaeon]